MEFAMDIIFLHDLRVETIIGVFDWERQVKQTVIIDLDMAFDIQRAIITDCIDDTLNYKGVAKRIITFIEASKFQLVETMAEHIATILLDEFHIPWVRVRINKQGAVRSAQDVGVIIERGQILS
jgi:dihydroneopterin aldolase